MLKVIDEQKVEDIKKLRDKSIILIGFSGGFRRNEIISLDYEDLDFVHEGVKIKNKKIKNRSIWRGIYKGYTLL